MLNRLRQEEEKYGELAIKKKTFSVCVYEREREERERESVSVYQRDYKTRFEKTNR